MAGGEKAQQLQDPPKPNLLLPGGIKGLKAHRVYLIVHQMRQRLCLSTASLQPLYFLNFNEILQLLLYALSFGLVPALKAAMFTLGGTQARSLSAREASGPSQSGLRSCRLAPCGCHKAHTSFLLFQIKHRWPQLSLLLKVKLQPGDLR